MTTFLIILGFAVAIYAGAKIVRLVTSKPDGIDRASKVEHHDMPPKPAGYVSPKGGR